MSEPRLRAAGRAARLGLFGVAALALAGCGERAPEESEGREGPLGEVASGGGAGAPGEPAPGTLRMAARLAVLEEISDYNSRVDALDATPRPTGLRESLMFGARRAYYLLNAGEHDAAAQELLRQLRAADDAPPGEVPPDFHRDLRNLLGMAALWGAIQGACLEETAACLFPPRPESFPPESRDRLDYAALMYESVVREDPDDLVAVWMLNLAQMARGLHPDSVPAPWRILPSRFSEEAGFPRFAEVGEAHGVDMPGHAGGSVMEDFDGDGDLDLMASSRYLDDQMRYWRNDAGGLVDRTAQAGLLGLVGGLNLVQADYDNDGDVDVFVLRGAWLADGQPNSLLRNEGDGTFADVSEEAGVLSVHPTQTAAWGDFDNDGWLDLIVGNETEMLVRPPRLHASELFRNNRDGTFTDVAEQAGVTVMGFVKAVAWGDYDNDGRLDLYVSRFKEPNLLFHNEGPDAGGAWRFVERGEAAGVDGPEASLPAWFFDYDNDGWLDIFVSSYLPEAGDVVADYLGREDPGETPRLYRNRGDGTFEDVTRAVRLDRVLYVMGSNYGDLDNDGWLDLYLGTGDPDLRTMVPNRMFRNDAGRRFLDVTVAGGFGHMAKGHAVAFGDLDHDGDQDLYVALGGAMEGDVGRNVLFVNPGHAARWVTLRLEGVTANRSAIGARIAVTVEAPGGERTHHVTAGSGGSFGGSSLQQEIGLGDATAIRTIRIVWPGSGTVDTYPNPPLDRFLRIREGDAAPSLPEVPLQPLAVGELAHP